MIFIGAFSSAPPACVEKAVVPKFWPNKASVTTLARQLCETTPLPVLHPGMRTPVVRPLSSSPVGPHSCSAQSVLLRLVSVRNASQRGWCAWLNLERKSIASSHFQASEDDWLEAWQKTRNITGMPEFIMVQLGFIEQQEETVQSFVQLSCQDCYRSFLIRPTFRHSRPFDTFKKQEEERCNLNEEGPRYNGTCALPLALLTSPTPGLPRESSGFLVLYIMLHVFPIQPLFECEYKWTPLGLLDCTAGPTALSKISPSYISGPLEVFQFHYSGKTISARQNEKCIAL